MVFRRVSHLAPLRVIAVLLAPSGIPPRGLDVAVPDGQIQTSVHAGGIASASIRDLSSLLVIVAPSGPMYWKPRPRLRRAIPGSSSLTWRSPPLCADRSASVPAPRFVFATGNRYPSARQRYRVSSGVRPGYCSDAMRLDTTPELEIDPGPPAPPPTPQPPPQPDRPLTPPSIPDEPARPPTPSPSPDPGEPGPTTPQIRLGR
ncbi:MAG TPA: hypothetical protein VNB91_10390 [Jatrophihabitantaceae bacterium]|nr:hypothetical protein [Jatrophihabitantaceae bacterium]